MVFRWEAPLFFANAGIFRQQVRQLVRERQPRWVVLQCEAITDIDVTAADMLEQLDEELNAQGVHLAFVELRSRLEDLVVRYGLFATLDRDTSTDRSTQALEAIAEAEPDRTGRVAASVSRRCDDAAAPSVTRHRSAEHLPQALGRGGRGVADRRPRQPMRSTPGRDVKTRGASMVRDSPSSPTAIGDPEVISTRGVAPRVNPS